MLRVGVVRDGDNTKIRACVGVDEPATLSCAGVESLGWVWSLTRFPRFRGVNGVVSCVWTAGEAAEVTAGAGIVVGRV